MKLLGTSLNALICNQFKRVSKASNNWVSIFC